MDTKDTQEENSSLLSYRMTQLEQSSKENFKKLEESTLKHFEKLESKIDLFTAQFVPVKTFEAFSKQNHDEHSSIDTEVGLLDQRIRKLDEKIEKHYIEVSDYPLVRKLVYGAVGLILVAVLGAVIGLVVINK